MTPIVIDNVIFDNLVSRYKDRKAGQQVVYVGDGVHIDGTTRSYARSPMDGDILVNSELAECVFDYVFVNLGIENSLRDHPVVVTEPYGNPKYSNNMLYELLIENYDVPSVGVGVDALFSYYHNAHIHTMTPSPTRTTGMVISSGRHATHVIPVVDGMPIHTHAKRLNWGGQMSESLLLKLFQLKYPSFPARMSAQDAQMVLYNHCFVAEDYTAAINSIPNDMEFDRIVQYPVQETPMEVDGKDKQVSVETQERREVQRKRFVEMAAQRREEKMREREEYLAWLRQLNEQKGTMEGTNETYEAMLKEEGIDSYKELLRIIKETEKKIAVSLAKAAAKLNGGVVPSQATEGDEKMKKEKEEETATTKFPLADVPDEQLTIEQIKEKRMQRLHRAQWQQRKDKKAAARKAEQIREKTRLEDEALRERDPDAWLSLLYERRGQIKAKLQTVRQLREESGKRKGVASAMRMKVLAQLAGNGNEETEKPSQSTSSTAASGARKKRKKDEDTFGMNDSDWLVYQTISRDKLKGEGGGIGESGDEEDDEERQLTATLAGLDEQLVQQDATFVPDHIQQQLEARKSVLHRLRYGGVDSVPETDISVQHQLRVNIERVCVPEAMWQPRAIAGVDQAGIGELIEGILRSNDQQQQMANNVFITGSHSRISGFESRVRSDVLRAMPVDSVIRVWCAEDVTLDAWRGAARWSTVARDSHLTREVYYEQGVDRALRMGDNCMFSHVQQ